MTNIKSLAETEAKSWGTIAEKIDDNFTELQTAISGVETELSNING